MIQVGALLAASLNIKQSLKGLLDPLLIFADYYRNIRPLGSGHSSLFSHFIHSCTLWNLMCMYTDTLRHKSMISLYPSSQPTNQPTLGYSYSFQVRVEQFFIVFLSKVKLREVAHASPENRLVPLE